MSEKTKQTIGLAGVFALCLTNMAYMSDLIILPCYAAIFGHFADSSPLVTNFIASGAQLTVIIGGLVAPVLMRYFSKKNILLVFFGLFVVQGSCTGLVDSAEYVAVMRGITGVFMGITFPTALALLVELFRDDDLKRTRYTGYFDGFNAGTGAILMIMGGILLSLFGWQSIFWGYLVGVPIWIMVLLFTPQTLPERLQHEGVEAVESVEDNGVQAMNWRKLVCILIACIAAQLFYGCIVYEFSIYLAENFDLPQWTNGVLGAVKGVVGFIMGMLVFTPLFRRAKRFTIAICFGCQALAYFGLTFVFPGVAGVIWFIVFYFFIGIAFGLSIPYYHAYSAAVFPAKRIPMITSAISICLSLGAFFSTYLVTLVETVFALETYTQVMPYIGAMCSVALILSIIAGITDKDKKAAFEKIELQGEQA